MSQGSQAQLPVRVLAVGSSHGDDQAGWRALELLRLENLSSVEMTALSTPLDVLDHLQGCRALVLLDACRGGSGAGAIVRLAWPLPATDSSQGASSHGFGVVSALALAESLGIALPIITLLGIEVAACEPGRDLSPTVRDALPEFCRRALHEVRTVLEDGIQSAHSVDHA